MGRVVYLLAFISLLSLGVLYKAGVDVVDTLSPQGCRMSWMSPSYILQTSFGQNWTPLAKRYSLWLYREVGWETHELHGSPVLFIPGNAGSSQQVRSIASSATRQYFSQPYHVSPDFASGQYKALDFFTVEFNEDLSAFHGATLEAEREYTSRAIDYILSLYPAGTSVTIMGHSMGGVVATSLLPHVNISSIITMSAPYILPPARFDRRIETIFQRNRQSLISDVTPILSLCGGATDLMVPSESCYIPNTDSDLMDNDAPYRRTIFTSALEGCWTGVGHREMVWCHQVRWRVARAAIELTKARTLGDRGAVLDFWLRDGHILPPTSPDAQDLQLREEDAHRPGNILLLRNPTHPGRYLLPVARSPSKFILYLSQGSIKSTAPRNPLPLRAAIGLCDASNECNTLSPTSLRLIPNPIPGQPFPVPEEGSDESEGVVLFEAVLSGNEGAISVTVEGTDGRGWLAAGFVQQDMITEHVGVSTLFFSTVSVKFPLPTLQTSVYLPHVLSSVLLVYRITPQFNLPCSNTDPLLQPLLQHISHTSESHYFPLNSGPSSHILLHTHASAPYIPNVRNRGLNLTIHTSGQCTVKNLDITVDSWGTLGRWGVRYWSGVGSWAVGVVSLLIWSGWSSGDHVVPPIRTSFSAYAIKLRFLVPASFILSFIPLPAGWWLGNGGEPVFTFMASFLLVIVSGVVVISWWALTLMLWPVGVLVRTTGIGRAITTSSVHSRRNSAVSLCLVFASIFLLVPWQVAFLGCWIFQLFVCAALRSFPSPFPKIDSPSSYAMTRTTPQLLQDTADDADFDAHSPTESERFIDSLVHDTPPAGNADESYKNASEHLLLLMTWLLPLAAPVLAVWVRTLMTAGYTTPFDGDHNALYVAPFLVLVEMGARTGGFMVSRSHVHGRLSGIPRHLFIVLTAVATVFGPRYTYAVFECASAVLGLVVLLNLRSCMRL